jgi:hypothetical protein
MDPISNTDNTNVTPQSDDAAAVVDSGAMPVTDASVTPLAEQAADTPTPLADTVTSEVTDATQVSDSLGTDSVPEQITGVSEPISDNPTTENDSVDLPPVAEPVNETVDPAPENIPVEPAPTDTPSTPDANLQNGAF